MVGRDGAFELGGSAAVTERRRGVVVGSIGGVYRVRLDRDAGGPAGSAAGREAGPGAPTEIDAFLRGRLKREARTGDRVVAGDRVEVAPIEGEGWMIESVEARRSELVRSGAGGRRPKIVAANLDRVIIVLSALAPPFRRETADRFLVLAESCDLPALLVVNKLDLEGAEEAVAPFVELFREVGYPVLGTSAHTGRGLEALRGEMAGRTSAFVGPSGVGKSSLLNALEPGLDLRTREVSRRAGRGRHTTVGARLLRLRRDIAVVDTPGFADVAAWGVPPEGLADAFPEMRERAGDCRFRECSHLHEPDCAVREAVDEGAIDAGRYASYVSLMES